MHHNYHNFGSEATGQPACRKATRGWWFEVGSETKGIRFVFCRKGMCDKTSSFVATRTNLIPLDSLIHAGGGMESNCSKSVFSRPKPKATASQAVAPPVVNYPEQQYPEQGNTGRVNSRVAGDPPRRSKRRESKR